MSLISTLYLGTRGLFASQLGMDVAGQNISNADVDGYSRKRINVAPDYRFDGTFGQMGFGVEVINIERMRNSFIDQQIRQQNHEVGFFGELDATMEQIENIVTEPADTGLLNLMDQFFDAWNNLSNNPADLSARTMVKTTAESLTDGFHNISTEIAELRSSRNEKIGIAAGKVNELAQQIFNFNREVGAVEIRDQKANDSRDRRDEALKELSKLIDIDVIENEIGQVTVTTGGSILISPVAVRRLETTTTSFSMPDGTTRTNIGLHFADTKRECRPVNGEIAGLFETRDVIIPQHEEQLNTLARTFVEKINELHAAGYTLDGISGVPFFDSVVTGASDIRISNAIKSNVENIAAGSSGQAHIATSNLFAAGALNFGAAPQQLSKTGTLPPSGATDIARNLVRNTVFVRATQGASTVTLREGIDYHINYVNGTIQMLHAGYDGWNIAADFQYRTGEFQGPGDNSNAVAIAQLRHSLTMNPDSLGNSRDTFTQFYSAFIGRLGLSRNEAASSLETREFLIEQYETQQEEIAGVSLDEEMADIIKYQHTYTAAARLITTTSQMLDVLMNM